jgi:hypothetical protein
MEPARVNPTLNDTSANVAAFYEQAGSPTTPTPQAVNPSNSDAASQSADPVVPSGVTSAVEPDKAKSDTAATPPLVIAVTISTAVQAAAFKTMPFRVGCALFVAFVAVGEAFDAPLPVPHLFSVIIANLVLILSSAWMLGKKPRTCKMILQQMHLRGMGGPISEWFYNTAGKLLRTPGWVLRVLVTLTWAAYVDSGSYIAAALIFYVLRSSPVAVGTGDANVDAQEQLLDQKVHSEL